MEIKKNQSERFVCQTNEYLRRLTIVDILDCNHKHLLKVNKVIRVNEKKKVKKY